MTAQHPPHWFWWFMILTLALANGVWRSGNLDADTLHRRGLADERLLSGKANAPEQYHILLPVTLELAADLTGLWSDSEATVWWIHFCLNCLGFVGAAWCLYRLLQRWYKPVVAFAGVSIYFALLPLGLVDYTGFAPEDLHVPIVFGGIVLIEAITRSSGDQRRQCHLALLVLVCVGTLNQALTLFLIAYYGLLLGKPQSGFTSMSPIPGSETDSHGFSFLTGIPLDRIVEAIRTELPQTIAAVLANLDQDRGVKALFGLPRALQEDVAERIQRIEEIQPEVMDDVKLILRERLGMQSALPPVDHGIDIDDASRTPNDWGWFAFYCIAGVLMLGLPRVLFGPRDALPGWTFYFEHNLTEGGLSAALLFLAPVGIAALWDYYHKPWILRRGLALTAVYLVFLLLSCHMEDLRNLLPVLGWLMPAALWTVADPSGRIARGDCNPSTEDQFKPHLSIVM